MAVNPGLIKSLPFFRDLPGALAEDLARVCALRRVSAREIVYLRDEAEGKVFLVLSGRVELYHATRGSRIAVAVFKEGDFFGDLAFVKHRRPLLNDEQARAVSDTQLCVVTTADMLRLLEKHSIFAMSLLVSLRERLHQAESKIKDLGISSAPTRVLNELIRYAVRSGEEKDGFYEIREHLTHQLVAEMSGLARETVTKTLGALEDRGFISYMGERTIRLNVRKIASDCVGCVRMTPP